MLNEEKVALAAAMDSHERDRDTVSVHYSHMSKDQKVKQSSIIEYDKVKNRLELVWKE